jgi:serine/threonine protein kinase
MGAVYLARHELMDAQRALKFLSADLTSDAAFTNRFLREGRMLRQIRHRNVVDSGDLERAEDDTLFFAMEFVDGPDLRGLLTECGGRMEPAQALAIARGIAAGLGAAHALGMVHRDIKPENILMAGDAIGWVPKIADFGIVATAETSTIYKTTRGSLLTPPYAAPEQWRGMRATELDGRTDIYALGGVLFEILTGRTVFDADSYEGWLFQHLETEPQPPSRFRPELAQWDGLDALVLSLLAKDRDKRPKDVAELMQRMEAIKPPSAHPGRETVVEQHLPRQAPVAGQVMRLSLDPEPAAEKPPAKRGLKWRWEFLLFAVIAFIFFVSWWENKRKQDQAIEDQPVQTADTSQPQPPAGTGASGPQDPNYQQAEKLVVQQKYKSAIPLLDQACTAGNAPACSELGNLFVWGPHATEAESVSQDFPRALKLLTRACDAGNAEGCGHLASMYDSGEGVAMDTTKAAALNTKACDGGIATACNNLGAALFHGAGVPEDKDKSRQAFKRGCDLGSQAACDWLKQSP